MKKSILSLAAVASIMGTTSITASAEEVVVDKGNTLWSISQDYGVTVNELQEMNGLLNTTIYPGQRLSTGENQEVATDSADVHTVERGDTLWSLGQQYGTSVSELKAWNNLSSDLIIVGEELTVNGEATAQPVETAAAPQASNTEQSNPVNETSEPKEATNDSNDQQNEAGQTMTMEATAYTANCEGCTGVTATGIDLNANPDQKVIAVDPDIIPLGSEVYVEGYGKAVAGDIGGDIQGNRIDIYHQSHSDAINFGRQDVEVTVLD
ncbi:peptidoglycan-binding protein [Pontibacillus halophilus JSM 076056 = DSM 19796]|uniref:Peptidoglycan-binding protein n=1 Tax=Pontibacillus halophilus JSM 076056 = DSM 19796 TaxID=1385510 RepID=A0A0A5GIP4_9BACI|nr:3D domain-containing protein [Pontibacillus halophilus]KGX91088.1 peptidoglycan-binding protein [Pontibacillus halophilus JSM 076056 = DSM 19796]